MRDEFGKAVSLALNVMREEKKVYKDYLPPEALKIGIELVKAVDGIWEDVLDTIIELCRKELPYEYPYPAVWWYSVIIGMKKDAAIFLEFIQYVRTKRQAFTKNTQFFLFYQIIYKQFSNASLYDSMINMELWKFYIEIVEAFVAECKVSLDEIPVNERDENLVLVTIDQVLSQNQAPTITALDRCVALQKSMKKKVLLLNTAEVLSVIGDIPFFGMVEGNYNKAKKEEKFLYWKEVEIPYYQCDHNMPDLEVMEQLLVEIRRMAPKRVVVIGGQSIFGALVNRMIPAITVGCVFSDLCITDTRYQTLTRKPTKEDVEKLQMVGYDRSHIIESVFTFDLKPQIEKVTREELQLPNDAFIMVVVGYRLDGEVSDEFLQLLEKILRDKMYIVFFGNFDTYADRIVKFPNVKSRSAYLGKCQDILSRMEICDLYINPLRKGGGSSCLEAMYKGKPVVTIGFGDVSVNSGEDFWVKDYKEMGEKILQYYCDKDFYQRMSDKALERSKILLDTAGEFTKIMEEYEKRETERNNRREQNAGL